MCFFFFNGKRQKKADSHNSAVMLMDMLCCRCFKTFRNDESTDAPSWYECCYVQCSSSVIYELEIYDAETDIQLNLMARKYI